MAERSVRGSVVKAIAAEATRRKREKDESNETPTEEEGPRRSRPRRACRDAPVQTLAAAAPADAPATSDAALALAPAPAPLTPWEESLVGDAFKAPEGSRFKDRDLLAGVDVYAHMRAHAARGRPVSTITGRLQPYRGAATGRPPKFVPLEVGKARR